MNLISKIELIAAGQYTREELHTFLNTTPVLEHNREKVDALVEHIVAYDSIQDTYQKRRQEVDTRYSKLWRPHTREGKIELAALCVISGVVVLPLVAGANYLRERCLANRIRRYDVSALRERTLHEIKSAHTFK